jgi:hypothetical protein
MGAVMYHGVLWRLVSSVAITFLSKTTAAAYETNSAAWLLRLIRHVLLFCEWPLQLHPPLHMRQQTFERHHAVERTENQYLA